ncbi:MAG: hypothetical protein Q8P95_00990 [bacterium]|nr:hypothetical protein [bacterium]
MSSGTQPHDDQMNEEERKRLMIQGYENQQIMKENIEQAKKSSRAPSPAASDQPADWQSDPTLMMDQGRLDMNSGEVIPDRMEQKEEDSEGSKKP